MISSFILLYSFNLLCIKTNYNKLNNWSWLITEPIKALKIKTSVQFNLDFANNAILLCFFFFFLIIDLYFLIAEVIPQMFNPVAEIVIPIGMPAEQKKAEMETH